jgi:hypothetical protein
MGRIKKIILNLLDKTEDFFANKYKESLSLEPEVVKDNSKFEMVPGKKLSLQELIEENKLIISTLDPKMNFLIELIREIKGEDILPAIAQDPLHMQQWLAHIAYRKKIDDFNFLISGKNRNTLDPGLLVKSKHRTQLIRKNIKCLTDLPLQKSLLN